MLSTSARLLRFLTLLQTKPFWPGAELARRLDVTDRTLRRDVDRLRSLGYPIQSTAGIGGGYAIGGGGSALPPLLLDDGEAMAIVLGLRSLATAGLLGNVEEASSRALAKLEQLLPARVHRRLTGLKTSIVTVPNRIASLDPSLLAVLANACHDCRRISFAYRAEAKAPARRTVEPYRVVQAGRRWYLVGWDASRRDWRTFRADRIGDVVDEKVRFVPRPPPDTDLARYVTRGISVAAYPFRARILLHASVSSAAQVVPPEIGQLESLDARRCIVTFGSPSPREMANWLAVLGFDFEVLDSPELARAVRAVAERYRRAAPARKARSPRGSSAGASVVAVTRPTRASRR